MPYDHLIAATVMTLDVCQCHSSIASFFSILTSASHSPSTTAELLVFITNGMDLEVFDTCVRDFLLSSVNRLRNVGLQFRVKV